MNTNFAPSLALVLVHEAGYVNDPQDPGGATNKGVTQTVYDDWRTSHGLVRQSVRLIDPPEVEALYRKRYWDFIKGDQLPVGIDYCVFDFAVNSGVNRASRYLQRAAGVAEDGQIGPATIAAVNATDSEKLIGDVCTARLKFLAQLPTFGHFGKGWTTRVNDAWNKAKAMAA